MSDAPSLPTVRCTDADEQNEDRKSCSRLAQTGVPLARDGVNTEHEQEGSEELGQERRRPVRRGERVCREDPAGRSLGDTRFLRVDDAGNGPQAAFVQVDLVL